MTQDRGRPDSAWRNSTAQPSTAKRFRSALVGVLPCGASPVPPRALASLRRSARDGIGRGSPSARLSELHRVLWGNTEKCKEASTRRPPLPSLQPMPPESKGFIISGLGHRGTLMWTTTSKCMQGAKHAAESMWDFGLDGVPYWALKAGRRRHGGPSVSEAFLLILIAIIINSYYY